MRQKLFTTAFYAFMITGVFVASTIACAAINEGLLYLFGTCIVIPQWLIAGFMSVFQGAGIICLLTAPVLLMSAIIRGFQEEHTFSASSVYIFFLIFMIGGPVLLLLCTGKYMPATVYAGVWAIASIIAGPGERLAIPKCFN